MDIEELLRKTVTSKASDLHLTVGAPPTIRLHGEMQPLPYPELTRDTLRTMLIGILTSEQQNRFEEKRDLDFSIEIPHLARFRLPGHPNGNQVVPGAWPAAGAGRAGTRGAWAGAGNGADRIGKVYNACRHGGYDQLRAPRAYSDGGRPD